MKLRNKKTGEIVTIGQELGDDFDGVGLMLWVDHVEGSELDDHKTYGSIAELIENWEDCEPVEPLIKDEKIRNAVRAWAEANGVEKVVLGQVNNDELVKKSPMTAFGCHVSFESSLGLERGRNYTITELCGEEE